MPNRLANETSPYLLQHKDNPVDWRPWGDEAFAEAKRRDVPVFLSVGYSTCYWCHVMEREVFENEALAKQMNEACVCIKVDREQRPDVDEHYMTATQVLAGQGGWPMSVFLTADGEPFFAGTYFPPADIHGRPGFGRVLESIGEAWRERRDDILSTVEDLRNVLTQLGEARKPKQDVRFDQRSLLGLVDEATSDFDAFNGGFGRAPKFPQQTLLQLLLTAQCVSPTEQRRRMLTRTLDALANGGIRDHLGGGFHRYSTDAKWLVPHFEIMLYDQAMLASCFTMACDMLNDGRYADVARRCLDFVLRDMTDATTANGAFYTAFDAEVDAREGDPYLWTPADVEKVLGETDAIEFAAVYGLDRGFNFADPHGPNPAVPDQNVLFLAAPQRESEPGIAAMREKLLAARRQRKQPMLDTKIITSWNGLMIAALAEASVTLKEPRYRIAAERAAGWIMEHHFKGDQLARSSRMGEVSDAAGVLEDYAHFGQACIALHQAGSGEVWRDRATTFAALIQQRFTDAQAGGFVSTATDRHAPGGIRRRGATDSPLPAGNASAALLFLELDQPDVTRDLLTAFASTLSEHPSASPTLLRAAFGYLETAEEFVVEGSGADSTSEVVSLAAEWVGPRALSIVLTIADGFHLYAPGHDGPERTVELAFPSEQTVASVAYPTSDDHHLTGKVRIGIEFDQDIGDGVDFTLSYQACTEGRCMAPVRTALQVRRA